MGVGIRSRVYESALRRRWSDAWAPLGEDLDAMTTLNLQYDLTFPENRAVTYLATHQHSVPDTLLRSGMGASSVSALYHSC